MKNVVKFKLRQVVMEKYDKSDFWKVGQIYKISGADYHLTDGRVRRAKQLRKLTEEEIG